MFSTFDQHKFNDDLLSSEGDREAAARRYPAAILHVLDYPELRNYFDFYNLRANRAKRKSRIFGLLAIGIGGLALIGASAERLMPCEHRDALAVISAALGISSVTIGGLGILFSAKKREWLYCRFAGERIRQFHFQTFACQLPEIIGSLKDDQAKAVFLSARNGWVDALKARFEGRLDSQFTKTIGDDKGTELWLHEKSEESDDIPLHEVDPLFRAYRELRIMHQIDYANYKLQDDYKVISGVPRRQAEMFSTVTFICIILFCVFHVGILIGEFAPSVGAIFKSENVNIILVWIAIVALAFRAAEQGIQPERECERYQQYRSALRAILDRFDSARSTAEKVRIMRQMERLAFDEMRYFLLTHERARFVI